MAMTLLNLCSGQKPYSKPWTNCDRQSKWTPDVLTDCSDLSWCSDGTVEAIVIEHGLEHFQLGEADQMLRECYRVLRPWGSLVVTTPDIKALARAWLEGKIDDYIFLVNVYGAYQGDQADTHKWNFTQASLQKTLQGVAPWRCVIPWDWREFHSAPLAKDWWIIGVEAIK